MSRKIGEIYNYYGKLHTKKEDDKFYWMIECVVSDFWEEIPQYLYEALNKFQDELNFPVDKELEEWKKMWSEANNSSTTKGKS